MKNRKLRTLMPSLAAVLLACAIVLILFTGPHTGTGTASSADAGGDHFGCLSEDVNLWGVFQKNEPAIFAVFALIIMAGYSLEMIVERWLRFTIARRQSRAFQSKVAEALYYNRIEEAVIISGMYPESPLACVVNSSLQNDSLFETGGAKAVRPSMQERGRAIVIKDCEIKRRLWTLAAIGWTAPLIGLFFAAIRITEQFRGWQNAEGVSFAPFAAGMGDATWGLSFSLVIAVPAIWMHKYFSSQAETFILEMDRLSLAIIEQFMNQQEKRISTTTVARYTTQSLDRHPTPRT